MNLYTENYIIDKDDSRQYYPPGYDAEECKNLWNKADVAMRSSMEIIDLQEIWKNTKMIEVGAYTKPQNNEKVKSFYELLKINTCFKDELFQNHGWCFTEGEVLDKGWGFCDSSCKIMSHRNDPQKLRENLRPDVYQKMAWEIDETKPHDHCIWSVFEEAPWYLCTKSSLPTITISMFHADGEGNLEYKGSRQEKKEDYAKHLDWGFQQTCYGDSGAGHWSFDSTKTRGILIAITSMSGLEDSWCSSPSVVTKITNPSIQSWIKKHAKINV